MCRGTAFENRCSRTIKKGVTLILINPFIAILFSATSSNRIRKLSKDIVSKSCIKIVQGESGHVNENVSQNFAFTSSINDKLEWLALNSVQFVSRDLFTIVFVNQKQHCDSVGNYLEKKNLKNKVLHGDLGQFSRSAIIKDFQNKKFHILIATDVASRGLDIPHVGVIVIHLYHFSYIQKR